MISHLVSSILNPSATAVAADKAAAQKLDEDRSRPVATTGISATPTATRLNRASVLQSGAGERIDYFHASKKMLRDSLADFSGGVQESLSGIGLDDGTAEKLTKSIMRQTKDALLWGVGFSVKLMTATVSMSSDGEDAATRPAFNIMARSIEVTVNHSDGVIDAATGNVSVESQFPGGPGAQQSHLLDISDSDGRSTGNLTSAMQALQDPRSLLADEDNGAEGDADPRLEPVASSEQLDALEQTLPRVDTPRVLSRPGYDSRILLSEMNHYRNDRNELISYLRLDALIPLTVKSTAAEKTAPPPAATLPQPPVRLAAV